MKEYLQSGWMRVLSCIICAISVVCMVIGILGFAAVTEFGDADELYEIGYKQIAENYGLYAIDMMENGNMEELQKEFKENHINCSIVQVSQTLGENDEVVTSTEALFTSGEIDEKNKVGIEVVAGTSYRYCENSLLAIMLGYTYYSDSGEWVRYPIERVVFDPGLGLFLYETVLGYYKVEYIEVFSADGTYLDYSLSDVDGQECYYNGYYKEKLNPLNYSTWDSVRIGGYRMDLVGAEANDTEWPDEIQVVPDKSILIEEIYIKDYEVQIDTISTLWPKYADTYQVQISWDAFGTSLFQEWNTLYYTIRMLCSNAIPMIVISFIIFVLGFGTMVYSAKKEKEQLNFMEKLPVFFYSGAVFMIDAFFIALVIWLVEWILMHDKGKLQDVMALIVLVAGVAVWLALNWFQNMVTRIKCKSFWRTTEVYYVYQLIKSCWNVITKPFKAIFRPFREMREMIRENTPLFLGGLIAFGVITIIEWMVISYFRWYGYGSTFGFSFLLVKVIEAVVLSYALFQMQALHEASKRVASGDMSQPIDTSKMFWKFKEHGENINKVSEGIALAVDERMKSERFKTELITNVSHDIKTPLTSIINYVDLIKKEEIADEKVHKYVDVLDRQSARLKKLIEDLMEASKASTGNLEVNLEECDMAVLLTQVIGEFEEKLQNNQLEVVVDKPDHPVKMMADGRHIWRVLDNLLNNACKYSLPNTRVYVSLKQENRDAVIVFKNISKEALNIPSDELMERFVRGDSSRNTEGSGLGLSIAQSLTELMHGTMKLEVDGDLFKVTLRFPAMVSK